MTRRLLAFVAIGALAACESRLAPTFPSAVPPTQGGPPATVGRTDGPRLLSANPIPLGQSVNGTIDADGPQCFPNWDATGRCLQYEVKVQTEGTLVATLTVSGPSRGIYNSEVFLVASDGNWFIHDDVWPERHVIASVLPGDVFRVVVLSYGPFPDAFEVRADARP